MEPVPHLPTLLADGDIDAVVDGLADFVDRLSDGPKAGPGDESAEVDVAD